MKISDVNDEKPTWKFENGETEFTADVEENTDIDKPVITLKADDLDFTPNFKTLRYEYVSLFFRVTP